MLQKEGRRKRKGTTVLKADQLEGAYCMSVWWQTLGPLASALS